MISPWREQMAAHLERAAQQLRARQDRHVERHIQVAIGYLERAGLPGNSKNAARLLTALREELGGKEQTLRMKFIPETEISRDSIVDEAPPSLPPHRQRGRR